MKYKYVFLLGRPGCGKSALYRELETRLLERGEAQTFERVDDFPKVWAILQRDNALEKEGKERIYSQRTPDGGYIATDYSFLNRILPEVSSDVLQIDKPAHMIFIEFARPNYVESIQKFDRRILDHCLVVYMEVDFETCWARNVARGQAAIAEGGDDHVVGRKTMEEFFLYDDQDALVRYLQDRDIPVRVVNNEADGQEQLKRRVEELLEDLF